MDPLLHIAPGDEGFWVDHISPFALVLWHNAAGDPIGIRWYGLAYLLGLLWGYWMVRRWVKSGRAPLTIEQIQDFVLWAGLGMIIGGRLGYCLFYGWDQLVENPVGRMAPYDLQEHRFLHAGEDPFPGHVIERRFDPPFLIQVWSGGMASHGGIVGLAVGCWLFARRNRISFFVLADIISATGPMGVALGRIANFINGELWGRPSHVSWAVIFPDAPRVGGYDVPRHPSQLYAMMLEGLIPLMIVLPLHARHRRPGLTSGAILCLYAVGRFVDECFREPDVGQPGGAPLPGHQAVPAILGFMSKGQFFTLPVLAIGLAFIIWSLRRAPRPELYAPPTPA
jgi:phosphatidylglycerol:prolipoprotein diacylglycerol transferase